MNRIAIAVVMSAVWLASCGSAEVKKGTAQTKLTVVHAVTYAHKGTKSESKSGSLSVNGIFLPDLFTAVEADGKLYTFRTRTQLWGNDGYFPAEDGTEPAFSAEGGAIGKDECARGWSEPARRGALPSGWILVKWDGGSAAVNPEKIKDLAAAKSLKAISRTGMSLRKPLK